MDTLARELLGQLRSAPAEHLAACREPLAALSSFPNQAGISHASPPRPPSRAQNPFSKANYVPTGALERIAELERENVALKEQLAGLQGDTVTQHGEQARDARVVELKRRVAELRVRKEAELLETEMELDARQAASADAAKIMREMQAQLMTFVQAEEKLCDDAESERERATAQSGSPW